MEGENLYAYLVQQATENNINNGGSLQVIFKTHIATIKTQTNRGWHGVD